MKKIKLLLLFAFGFLVQSDTSAQVKINPAIYGQAYWFTDHNPDAGQPIQGLGGNWRAVKDAGIKLVRAGGKQYNISTASKPTTSIGYVTLVDSIRAQGCEPVITIPFQHTAKNGAAFQSNLTASITKAKEIIRLVNLVHKRNVKYIVIANEPCKDYGYCGSTYADSIAIYTKELSKAIKDVDNTIKTIGPEHHIYDKSLYDLLFSGNGDAKDISGLIDSPGNPSDDKPIIDFISVHQYLFEFQDEATGADNGYKRVDVVTRLDRFVKSDIDLSKRYRGVLNDMKTICNNSTILSNRGSQPLGFMITEANVNTLNELVYSSGSNANPNLNGIDTRSFLGGQTWARMAALAMEYGCTSILYWSVKEGCSTTRKAQDRGFLDGCDNSKRPSWYHMKNMSKWFNGIYLKDEVFNDSLINKASAFLGDDDTAAFHRACKTKAFASIGSNIAVMVLNHNTVDVHFTIRLDGSSTFGFGHKPKKFSFKAGVNAQLNDTIAAESSLILVYSCSGTLLRKYKYRKSIEATEGADFLEFKIGLSAPTVISSTVSDPTCISGSNSITLSNWFATTYTWYKLPSTTALSGTTYSQTGLKAGAYKTEITRNGDSPVCARPSNWATDFPVTTVSVLNVVHQFSPLVDAGPDRQVTSCTTATIGSVDPLPASGQGYSWSPSITCTASPCTTGTVSTSGLYAFINSVNSCIVRDTVKVTGTAGTIAVTRNTLCGTSSSTNTCELTWTPNIIGLTLQWQKKACDMTFVNVWGSTNPKVLTMSDISDGDEIRATVSCSGTTYYSNSIMMREIADCSSPLGLPCQNDGSSSGPPPRMAYSDSLSLATEIRIFPNPNTGSFTLTYELAKEEAGSIVIYDVSGRKVAEYNLANESTSLNINENLEEGIYLYKVVVNGKAVKTDKLVIIK